MFVCHFRCVFAPFVIELFFSRLNFQQFWEKINAMKCYCLIVLNFLFGLIGTGQVSREMKLGKFSYEVVSVNNHSPAAIPDLPGMNAFIFIATSKAMRDSMYEADELRKLTPRNLDDFSCFYYVSTDSTLVIDDFCSFVKDLIYHIYQADCIDRNKVQIIVENDYSEFVESKDWRKYASQIHQFNLLSTMLTWNSKDTLSTDSLYYVPGFLVFAEGSWRENNVNSTYRTRKGLLEVGLDLNAYLRLKHFRSNTEYNSLVDFSKYWRSWNLRVGYYLSESISIRVQSSITYTGKKKHLDSLVTNSDGQLVAYGSGYAGMILKTGIGIGYSPSLNDKVNIPIYIGLGNNRAMIAEGKGERKIGQGGENFASLQKQKESTLYVLATIGLAYSFDTRWSFNTHLGYEFSEYNRSIGRLTAYAGWSLSFGFSVMIGKSYSSQQL
jgi:hypothetical protein